MPSEASIAGIVTDVDSGERQIPESVRADGSTRKVIKIRPGYRPPEDVEVYKNQCAQSFRERGQRIGIPGADGLRNEQLDKSNSASSSKNAKRREARKRAAKSAADGSSAGARPEQDKTEGQSLRTEETEDFHPVESEKRARNLRKKLKQTRELQNKKNDGEALLPEQIAKVLKINELVRELCALGFDAEEGTRSEPLGTLA